MKPWLVRWFAALWVCACGSAQTLVVEANVWIEAPTVDVPSITTVVGIPAGAYLAGDGRPVNVDGSSRVSHMFVINGSTWEVLHNGVVLSPTHLYNAQGQQIDEAIANGSTLNQPYTQTPSEVTWTVSGNPSNPTIPGAPGITYSITIQIHRNVYGQPIVSVQSANHDHYPSYEVRSQWNGDPPQLHYYSSESEPTALWGNPIAAMAGVPPINYHAPEIPWIQQDSYISPADYIDDWLVDQWGDGVSPDGEGLDDVSGVIIHPLELIGYQTSDGQWHSWSE